MCLDWGLHGAVMEVVGDEKTLLSGSVARFSRPGASAVMMEKGKSPSILDTRHYLISCHQPLALKERGRERE